MTKEDKELLVRDLSSRLPYGVRINGILPQRYLKGKPTEGTSNELNVVLMDIFVNREDGYISINNIWSFNRDDDLPRPYLRPLAKMTKEEQAEHNRFFWNHYHEWDPISNSTCTECVIADRLDDLLEFYYSHHIDFRGLIEKGLALEAPKDMYKL